MPCRNPNWPKGPAGNWSESSDRPSSIRESRNAGPHSAERRAGRFSNGARARRQWLVRAARTWCARAVMRQAVVHEAEGAQAEARPHSHAEVKRHPGDLVSPLGDVVRHHPARAEIVQAAEQAEEQLAARDIRLPAADGHRHADRAEEHHITEAPTADRP